MKHSHKFGSMITYNVSILKIKLILKLLFEKIEHCLKRFFIVHTGIRLFVITVGFIDLKNNDLSVIIGLILRQENNIFFTHIVDKIDKFKSNFFAVFIIKDDCVVKR